MVDREAGPGTEPFVPDFDDTGSQPVASVAPPEGSSPAVAEAHQPSAAPATETVAGPVSVPGRYLYAPRWKLVLVVLGVWLAAAEVGLSLFYWWYHTLDKTAAVFVVLVYIVVCTLGGLMLSMVPGRPLITALSLGVMSGPFASVAAAAPLYGYYYCARVGHCLVGVIPY
ncbi:hypothetical protein H7H78_06470 [Mycobacterium shinjukuense]|uniref:Uncharacterized protein n=1 Tax=Mycobacterium shinjukuense TaxID=398694 RepID=A0A7I7MT26_9MYCO|nr:hypothetical protein [Mycobacterium shinjukuense]MCV6985105.1 hypothetical protein [Mycobacterium shinjukuense]ORB70754.1 hypothetical protein BST45_05005 [Mycobacterium shinjukuense]BBX75070.1 hypothetical protein MSHI_29760 [Mycobacterium shinjukuense]